MAGLKSLGLAGARRAGAVTSMAFRKLFRRTLPADDDVTDTPTTPASAHASEKPGKQKEKSKKQKQHQQPADDEENHRSATGTRSSSETATTSTSTSASAPTATMRVPVISAAGDGLAPRTQSQRQERHKENQRPTVAPLHTDTVDDIATSVEKLTLNDGDGLDGLDDDSTKEQQDPEAEEMELTPEKAMHLKFIREALDMARLALRTNETPVGCVLVHDGKVIARGMNATNVTRNGTRHAEFMALSALLSYAPRGGPKTTCLKPKLDYRASDGDSEFASVDSRQPDEGNEDGSMGHLYPYGQKLHPDERVDRSIVQESVLYVTVEPCVMCASLLRQLKIRKVYFGAVNDKFGGTGGVFSIHANSMPISADGQTASAHPTQKPITLPDGNIKLGTSFPPSGGDGGNVEQGYEIEGGWGRDDAVGLLRRFYVQENGRAPVPRKKEGRAARLAAMMEKDGNGSVTSTSADAAPNGELDEIPVAPATMEENVKPGRGEGDITTKLVSDKMGEDEYSQAEGDRDVLKERPVQ